MNITLIGNGNIVCDNIVGNNNIVTDGAALIRALDIIQRQSEIITRLIERNDRLIATIDRKNLKSLEP